jgi:CIC family chloride channel protein
VLIYEDESEMKNTWFRWLDRFQISDSAILGAVALGLGLATGIGVWLFKEMILLSHNFFLERIARAIETYGIWTIALIPVLGGLIVGLIQYYFIGIERYHGVAGIIESVALSGGRLRYWRIPAKTIASAVSIGAGASVGPEDPSVQIGSNLGSMFGSLMKMSEERVRTLVAAGAAAGVASAFNAPIAGVFFAVEIILGEIGTSALGIVVLSSVIASVFTQAVAGVQPAFSVPPYAFNSPWELLLYFVLGMIAGPLSALYVKFLYQAQDYFHGLKIPRWGKPAIAGLLVGIAGIFLPEIFGEGYHAIGDVLNGQNETIWLLFALMIAKLVMTPISIGGGFAGGVFAPALFIGAMLGGGFGLVAQNLFPGLNIVPAAFAMVGMAAVLAGAVHAPLTAILLLFEMTHDYRIILPLMFAVVISLLISKYIESDSVYMLGLARKGIRIERGRDVEVLERITVDEVMTESPPFVREDMPIKETMAYMNKNNVQGLPVLNRKGELFGLVTMRDIRDTEHDENDRIGEISSRDLLVAYPDDTIGAALRRMAVQDIGRMPVVSRENQKLLVGLLRRADAIRAYDIALKRHTLLRHRAHQARLDTFSGVDVQEVTIQRGAECDGATLRDADWPRDCVIASVRRGREFFIPRGDTILQAGDVLVFVAEGEAREAVERLCAQ